MNSDDTSSFEAGDSAQGEPAETNVRQKVADSARHAVDKVKSSTGDALAKAKDKAGRVASEKKEAAANRVGAYGSAIHESARALEEKDPNIAWFTHRAADKLEHVAEYVRGRDLSELREDAASVARRHPMAFFGGMFAMGLIVGNVLKASPRKARRRPADSSDSDQPEMAEPDMMLSEQNASAEWGGM